MEKREGIHFYINISNLDDVSEAEEKASGEVRHTIHALDTFFSSIEAYGKRHYHESFVVEKITGSRLHMYVVDDDVAASFEIVSAVSQYAYKLTGFLCDEVSKYKSLLPFQIQVGACYGRFYEFEFKRDNADELTTIGYAANFAAKLQNMADVMHIRLSENIYDALEPDQKKTFSKIQTTAYKKYEQDCCYESLLSQLVVKYNFQRDLERASQIALQVDLKEMNFRDATQPISFRTISRTELKKLNGIPFFADVRGFTSKFDADDTNLDEMAQKTQSILTTMCDVVERCKGIHVQFQGDREMALFHDYPSYSCASDAVIAGLRIIDGVKTFHVSVGVGQSCGRLFAAKIGARGQKDIILIGRTVNDADRNEDELALENQLVISEQIYRKLKAENIGLSELFNKLDEHTYFAEVGYQDYLARQEKRQLQKDNKNKTYNGAWRE